MAYGPAPALPPRYRLGPACARPPLAALGPPGVLRDLDDSQVDGPGVSWVVAGVTIALVSIVVFLIGGLIGWGWGVAGALVLPLLAGSAACFLTAQRRVRRAKRILTHHVIQASSQASLAQRHPLLGARLERATSVILELHRLRRDEALAGVLDIDEDLVDRLHYEMVNSRGAGPSPEAEPTAGVD